MSDRKAPGAVHSGGWPVDDGFATSSIPKAGKGDPALPLEIDPPAHVAVRQLLNRVMSPNAARALQSRIEYWTTRHIDAVMHVGACDLAYDITSI